jgi:hypothetical protein
MIDITRLAENLARELTPILIPRIGRLLLKFIAEAML